MQKGKNMKKAFVAFTVFLFGFLLFSQNVGVVKTYQDERSLMVELSFTNLKKHSEEWYELKFAAPIKFNSFGFGWKVENSIANRGDFLIYYRVHNQQTDKWSEWKETDAFVSPEETPTGLYWTDVLFGEDLLPHDSIECKIYLPHNVFLEEMRVSLYFVKEDSSGKTSEVLPETSPKDCPAFPSYISRSGWCGSNSACLNPTYTITYINPTHTVIHHGASPNTYTNGAAVVYSYWNYHVNTLGWNDIGYNYLLDKYGNMYQGRHNPYYLNPSNYKDVLGAHAGASNSYSIGVNFLGNADVTTPTAVQLDKCEQLLAWWYNHYGFDPTSSASIVLQSGGTGTVKRICGHRDVNIGGTTCPGDTLYSKLPTIRTETKNKILACSTSPDNTPPTTAIQVDGNVLDNWRGTNFWVDFSDYDNSGGSGIDTMFWQVTDYDGAEWRCNPELGFFNDNFNSSTSLSNYWTIVSGNWSVSNGHLYQTNESLTNPNIYTPLTQTNNYIYLYHYQGMMQGTGTNRRFGFFFFVSDPTQTYRGNAYMVYFRIDGSTVEIYKSTNNSISGILAQGSYTFSPNTWYDFKVIYNPNTGVIKVYVNNTFVVSWTDPTPLTSGGYISLRTGGCIGVYDDFKVYRSRTNTEQVTVGTQASKMIKHESPNKQQEACRIKSVVLDKAGNWSSVANQNVWIDWTAPTTQIPSFAWQTGDFMVNFQDTDNTNGSGISRRFYQVRCWNGQEWVANPQAGFFYDDLEGSTPTHWTTQTGTWVMNNGVLMQTDQSLSNTNIWTSINQTLSNRYLYEFDMKIEGSGTDVRAGFHFMSDSATLPNRRNSYFIWFRLKPTLNQYFLEFYKVYNDSFEQMSVIPIQIQLGTWYNVKVVYDRISGEQFVYLNNKLIGEWKDDSPFSTGKYISFRSGNSILSINNVRVYRTRYPQVTIKTQGSDAYVLYDNPDPGTPAAKIASIVADSAHNLSIVAERSVNIDRSAPQFNYVWDGFSSDADTLYDDQVLSARWSAVDPNSGVAEYWFALGTSAGDSDVIGWTSVGTNTQVSFPLPPLTYGQRYYVSIRAKNNAGLMSMSSSDGFVYWTMNVPVAKFHVEKDTLCLPEEASFVNESEHATMYEWDFGDGTTSTDENPIHVYEVVGSYTVRLIAKDPPLPADTFEVVNAVTVRTCTGMEELRGGMRVYPQPFVEELNISFGEPFSGHVKLLDEVGREVISRRVEHAEKVRLSELAKLAVGQYMLEVYSDNGSIQVNMIVQKTR